MDSDFDFDFDFLDNVWVARPDMTSAVDWALKLSQIICLSIPLVDWIRQIKKWLTRFLIKLYCGPDLAFVVRGDPKSNNYLTYYPR